MLQRIRRYGMVQAFSLPSTKLSEDKFRSLGHRRLSISSEHSTMSKHTRLRLLLGTNTIRRIHTRLSGLCKWSKKSNQPRHFLWSVALFMRCSDLFNLTRPLIDRTLFTCAVSAPSRSSESRRTAWRKNRNGHNGDSHRTRRKQRHGRYHQGERRFRT